ncbi:hypothetical protein BDV29DRAFT_159924 [Aspergillus leporis]|uniref:Uncharacterized protein n=1 Tax=Aspergillus leporis TaxID=41062 RepID=A0A5N5WTF6_9EURO|nr:hypothetical protein BDV29DRAFT_159924 [Aspergillus leporis]
MRGSAIVSIPSICSPGLTRIDTAFWGSGAIGIATVPDFWQVIHDGDVTVHRTEIESLSHLDVVSLKNGFSVTTDIVIHYNGFEKGSQHHCRKK